MNAKIIANWIVDFNGIKLHRLELWFAYKSNMLEYLLRGDSIVPQGTGGWWS